MKKVEIEVADNGCRLEVIYRGWDIDLTVYYDGADVEFEATKLFESGWSAIVADTFGGIIKAVDEIEERG